MLRRATAIIRFLDGNGAIRYGHCDESKEIVELLKEGTLFTTRELSGEKAEVHKVLAPLEPKQIICIGLNYKKHAEETGLSPPRNPIWLMKNVASIQNPGDPIIIPEVASSPDEVDYEGELAFIIKDDCKDVRPEHAHQHILGYTIANDVSARRWQGKKGGGQWCHAKSFDTFCPLGPMILAAENCEDPQNLSIRTALNGHEVQSSNTRDMIFPIAEIISVLSKDMTLPRGTLVLTGTPEGVGFTMKPPVYLKDGDEVAVTIDSIGVLNNPVRARAGSSRA